MSRHRFTKAIVSTSLVAVLTIGGGLGTAGAHHKSDRGPHVRKGSVVHEDGLGYNPRNGKDFCVVNVGGVVAEDRSRGFYGCTREPGEGGGPRWARADLLWDHADGTFDGKGGPTLRRSR